MYRLFIISLAVFFLSACSSLGSQVDLSKLSCPQIGILKEASDKIFKDSNGDDSIFIEISDFRGSCSFKEGDGQKIAKIDLNLTFFAEGNQNTVLDQNFSFKYFIAILAPNEKILNKKIFQSEMELDLESKIASISEEITQKIPVTNFKDAKNYKIVFGIQP